MRYVTKVQGPESPGVMAFGARLKAMEPRGKVQDALCLSDDEPLTDTPIYRRFWTPDEITGAADCE